MNTPDDTTVYKSSVLYDESRVHAAALYCSDGRFGEQIDDFLCNGLQLPRCDRLAAPGGGGILAGHALAVREEDVLLEQLRFLFKVHDIERVVLIAHQGCAFYSQLLQVPMAELESRQREDLLTTAQRLRASFNSSLAVDGYFARKHPDGTVSFESLWTPSLPPRTESPTSRQAESRSAGKSAE